MRASVDKIWTELREYFATHKITYNMKEMFDDIVAFLNSYETIVKDIKKAEQAQTKKTKPASPRKPLQPIHFNADNIIEQSTIVADMAEDFLKNIEMGIYRVKTPHHTTIPSCRGNKVRKSEKREKASKPAPDREKVPKSAPDRERDLVGCRIRRVGKPTFLVGQEGPIALPPKLNTPDENEDIPDAKTLIEQLKSL